MEDRELSQKLQLEPELDLAQANAMARQHELVVQQIMEQRSGAASVDAATRLQRCLFVSWRFEPSQPKRITSGLFGRGGSTDFGRGGSRDSSGTQRKLALLIQVPTVSAL